MAFVDNWRPRIDGVDDADSSAVNEIAAAVIINEGKISKSNQIFANALKGTATGAAVRMDDVSPLPHEMAVKVSGAEDISAVKVLKYGKNLLPVSALIEAGGVMQEDGSVYFYNASTPSGRVAFKARGLAGQISLSYDVKTLTIGGSSGVRFMAYYANGSYAYIGNVSSLEYTATHWTSDAKKQLDRIEFDYGSYANSTWLKNAQIEVSPVVTEYTPSEPTEYTPNADGTVDGVTAIYPTTTLMTDTEGAVLDVEYNRDINKAFAAFEDAVNALAGA